MKDIPPIRGNQRVLLLGKTNSGKSFFARLMLSIAYAHNWRIVIVDPKRDWMGRGEAAHPFAENKSLGTINSPCLIKTRLDPSKRVSIIQPVEWNEQCDMLSDDVMALGNTIIYFDEISQLVTANYVPLKFKILWTQGRSLNVGAWCATQKPTGIPMIVKDQAEIWVIFRLTNVDDRKIVKGYVPLDQTPLLLERPLPDRFFWYYEDTMDKPILFRPIRLVTVHKKVA